MLSVFVFAFGPCGGDEPEPGPPPESTVEPAATIDEQPTPDQGASGIGVIAINANAIEEFPAGAFWAGEDEDTFTLPSGYWFLIVDREGEVLRTEEAVESDGVAPISLEDATETIPGDEGEPEAAFETLARFLMGYHAAYLSSLNVLTGGFETSAFDPAAQVSGDDAEQLLLAVGELEAQRAAAASAADVLGRERFVAASAGPSAGIFDFLKEKIDDPINAQERAKNARQDLSLAFGRMTLSQQREAFRQLKEERGLEIEAEDSAAFIEQLDEGEYDNLAAQARNFLQNHEDFFDYFDLRNVETSYREASELVKNGSEFYAKALKDVLTKMYPGIEKGWDAVEKLEEALQRMQHPEIRPTDVAEMMRRMGYDITDDEAESIAQVVQYSFEVLKAQAASRGKPAPTPMGLDKDGGWGVYDMAPIEVIRHGKLGLLVAEVDKVNNMKICNLSGGGLCEGANATATLGQAGGVTLILGPFETFEDATRAFCDDIVPDSVYYSQFWGMMARMKYDGELHTIDNAPGC